MAPATREPALKWRAGAGRGADPRFLAKNTAVYAPGGGTRARGRPGGSARPGETRAAGTPRPRARRKSRRFWPETRIRPPGGRARARTGSRTGGAGRASPSADRVASGGRLGAGRGAPGRGGRKRGTPARQPRTPSGEPAPGRPTGRARHGIRRRPGRKNTGRPGANCPQGSGRGGHPRPSEAKRTRCLVPRRCLHPGGDK